MIGAHCKCICNLYAAICALCLLSFSFSSLAPLLKYHVKNGKPFVLVFLLLPVFNFCFFSKFSNFFTVLFLMRLMGPDGKHRMFNDKLIYFLGRLRF